MLTTIKSLITKRSELILVLLVLTLSCFLRLYGLGYSSYYGDETKTLYLDKTLTAANFLLDQRKGPVQFLAAWVMEKISGGYSEFYIRLPFAIAGTLSVLFFYLLGKKFFEQRTALISTVFYSLGGFSIAFSRTAQYQSFLILFGISSVYFFAKALELKKRCYFLISSLLFTLSLFSHYDAIFFLIPIVYMVFAHKDKVLGSVLTYFILPAVLLLSVFYVPYIYRGYLSQNTVNYVSKRMTGEGYEKNNSLYTFNVYNPLYLHFILVVISFTYFLFLKINDKVKSMIIIWFLFTFIVFELLISNPGTHIHNYLLPVYFVSGFLFTDIINRVGSKNAKFVIYVILFSIVAKSLVISFYTFLPGFNNGYPWKQSRFIIKNVSAINKANYHLYLYGFPYDRGWGEIKEFVQSTKGVRGYYTNDSAVSSRYYLQRYDYTPPGSNFLPQYYIDVESNMEFRTTEDSFLENYVLIEEIVTREGYRSGIYKLAK